MLPSQHRIHRRHIQRPLNTIGQAIDSLFERCLKVDRLWGIGTCLQARPAQHHPCRMAVVKQTVQIGPGDLAIGRQTPLAERLSKRVTAD